MPVSLVLIFVHNSHSPKLGLNDQPDPEDRSCDGLNRGFDVDEGNLEGGFLDVSSGLNVMQH
jgi:hypothetical protein